MSFILPPDALDRDLVFEFFWKFSVFECALKREGFLRLDRPTAEANWTAFGKDITQKFEKVETIGFAAAAAKLRELSPRKQINRNGILGWEKIDQRDESNAVYTLHLLKTVRNNLFHGGKYPDGGILEVSRDTEILRAALAVLEGCYELHGGVKDRIDEIAA
jgi:hypothetical protein